MSTIIFDFDGTLALGHGPVRAYAREIARATGGEEFVGRVDEELRVLDAGGSAYRDGYHVVATCARRAGVGRAALNAAFHASRAQLSTDAAPVVMPAGLPDILAELHPHARLVVATNSPRTGIEELFDDWGVLGYLAKIHVNVGKPHGLYPIIAAALERGSVLSIGDIPRNDIQPALDLGADTALVGPAFASHNVDVTMRAPGVAELCGDLLRWASGQEG